MAEDAPDIVIVEQRIEPAELARLVLLHFEDMVKYVVDIERRVAAVGGELPRWGLSTIPRKLAGAALRCRGSRAPRARIRRNSRPLQE